jgi:hypothetical protein
VPTRNGPGDFAHPTELRSVNNNDSDDDHQSRRGALIAVGAVVLIFVIGLILFRVLSESSRMQDCLLSGRTNCAPIERPPQ